MKSKYKAKGGALDTFLSSIIKKRFKDEVQSDFQIRKSVRPIEEVITKGDYRYEVSPQGVFFKEGGEIFRSFLYLSKYEVETWKRLPSMHLFECETVLAYTSFSVSNKELVDIYCKNTGNWHLQKKLPVCGNCKNKYAEIFGAALFDRDFHDVILDFEEAEETRTKATGTDGYILNWTEISTAYRKSKNWTCERCNFVLTNRAGEQYMHTHHKNYDKTDNRRSNLECLCIECHANVDETHRRNFSTPYQQRQIEDFKTTYK